MRITGISPSAFNTYSDCEWRYALTQILGFVDLGSGSTVLGNLVHKILEILNRLTIIKHNPNSKYWNIEYLWKICFNRYHKLYPEQCETIPNTKLKAVSKGIIEFLNSEYSPINNHKILCAEKRFYFPIEETDFLLKNEDNEKKYLSIRCVLDRVDKLSDDTIELIDFKTGSRRIWNDPSRRSYDSETLKESIQPRLYHLALKRLYPWAKQVLITFIYLVDGGPVTTIFTDEDIPITKDLIKKRVRLIKNNNNPERIIDGPMKWKCKMCAFFKDGTCDKIFQEKQEMGFDFVTNKYRLLNDKK